MYTQHGGLCWWAVFALQKEFYSHSNGNDSFQNYLIWDKCCIQIFTFTSD